MKSRAQAVALHCPNLTRGWPQGKGEEPCGCYSCLAPWELPQPSAKPAPSSVLPVVGTGAEGGAAHKPRQVLSRLPPTPFRLKPGPRGGEGRLENSKFSSKGLERMGPPTAATLSLRALAS